MNTDLTNIEDKARRMRSAIESIPPKERPLSMFGFPDDASGDEALLLGAYFADCGIEGFFYVLGRRGPKQRYTWTNHSWLARETLVVDIAADFWDAPSPVIVADPSPWHKKRWSIEDDPLPSDFRDWNPSGLEDLRNFYARIRSGLFSSSDE